MECYSVIAEWRDEPGGPAVEAWANFHGPFSMVPVMASALGMPMAQLRLHVPPDIGGSFGIKAGIYPYVVLMALASKHAGRPVRWTEDRIEHLLASSAGTDRVMRFEAAVDARGCVLALRVDLVDNVGAYLRPPEPSTLYRCFGNITGAYTIGAVQIRARAVVTNKTPCGLNRGFGGQQLYFGLERLMDEVAGRRSASTRPSCAGATSSAPMPSRTRRPAAASTTPGTTTGPSRSPGERSVRRAAARQAVARARGEWFGIGLGDDRRPVRHEHRLRRARHACRGAPAGGASPARPSTSGSASTLQGVVRVLLGTVPQGQGHATVARDVVARRLGSRRRAGAAASSRWTPRPPRGRSPPAATPPGSRRC